MPDICFKCEQKKTHLQFLRHLIFQFGIVCLCFLAASHKVSGLILLDDGSSYSFMSIMIFFFCKIFQNALGSRHVVEQVGIYPYYAVHTIELFLSRCLVVSGGAVAARRALQLLQPRAVKRRRWRRRRRIVAAQSALRISMPRLPSLFFTLNGNTEGKYSNNATIDSRLATRANYYTNVY